MGFVEWRDKDFHLWKRWSLVRAKTSGRGWPAAVHDSNHEAPYVCHDLGLYVSIRCGQKQVLKGNINASGYIGEILEPKLLHSARDLFGTEPFTFQQDGAPCHTAHLCKKWFAAKNVAVSDWPGNSPDLNPIENLWSRLKRAVAQRRPSKKQQLIEAILASWFHIITASDLQNLVESMPRRCQAVIDAKGYPTRYWT